MRGGWISSGACTSGSTALPRGATRRASGGAATTSTTGADGFPASLPRRLGAALRRQRGADDRLVRVHVGDGRDADARRLDDVDGVDADARTDVAGRRGLVPLHVGRHDGGDDAAVPGPDAVALPPSRGRDRRDAPRPSDRTRGRRILLRVDRVRNGRLSTGCWVGNGCDAAAV